jgi:hypothetical protein
MHHALCAWLGASGLGPTPAPLPNGAFIGPPRSRVMPRKAAAKATAAFADTDARPPPLIQSGAGMPSEGRP